MQSIFYFKEHWFTLTIITITLFFVTIVVLLFKYKSILQFIRFLYALSKLCFMVILKPLRFLFDILKFQCKKDILSIQLALTLKMKNDALLPNIFLNMFIATLSVFTLILAYNIQNNDYKSTLYMIDGALISIWLTHFVNIISSLLKVVENLETSYTVIADVRQMLTTHYEQLIPFFPYKDDLFKKGSDILYITPVHAGLDNNYLNEELAKNFLAYIQQLNLETLYNSFNSQAAKNLIQVISNQQTNRQVIQHEVINTKEFIANSINSLFQQVISCINKILSFSTQFPNWELDRELSPQMSMLFYVYIVKLTNCILFVQQEFKMYSKYVNHVSHPPKLPIVKNLEDVVNINQQIKQKNKIKK